MPISTQNAAVRPPAEPQGDTAESLGKQVQSLLPPLRLHSLSVFDTKGDVQWLSEGALGPDEQHVIEESIATLTTATTRAHLEAALADGRAALFLAVRTPRATLAGVVMLLMDAKTLNSGNLAARVLTTGMRSTLQKVAMLLAPPPPLGATATLSGIRTFTHGTVPMEVAVVPGASVGDTANESIIGADSLDWAPDTAADADAKALSILEPAASAAVGADDLLSWGDTDASGTADLAGDSPSALAQRAEELLPSVRAGAGVTPFVDEPALRLRELLRLRAGGRTRRYQIVPVAEQQRGNALVTLTQLLGWLKHNPQLLQGDPISFTIGVSAEALSDPALPAALERELAASGIERGIIGFELREPACIAHRSLAEKFLAQCEKSHCFAVIDDFTFHTDVLDLLRSRALTMVKVEARLVGMALRDKLAQARVIAIAQAAKVLGTHCAAKYVDSHSGRRWLSAAGFDFTQSSVTEPMQRLAPPASI